MKYFKIKIFLFLIIPVFAFSSNGISLNGSEWQIQQEQFVYDTGEQISLPGYNDSNWLKANVPSTVLEPYVNAGIFPEPFFANRLGRRSTYYTKKRIKTFCRF